MATLAQERNEFFQKYIANCDRDISAINDILNPGFAVLDGNPWLLILQTEKDELVYGSTRGLKTSAPYAFRFQFDPLLGGSVQFSSDGLDEKIAKAQAQLKEGEGTIVKMHKNEWLRRELQRITKAREFAKDMLTRQENA